MKHSLNLVVRLLIICVVAAFCLGVTYDVTSPIIAKLAAEEAEVAYRTLLPDAVEFVEMDFGADEAFAKVAGVMIGVNQSETVGWCINMKAMGYKGEIPFIIGVLPDGSITGLRIGAHEETVGLGSKISSPSFYEQFDGVRPPVDLKTDIQAISGATISSRAVVTAVNTAHAFYQAHLQ